MPSFAYDISYLNAGLLDLENYLFSNEVYWPISATAPVGDPPYPLLTLGGMLLSKVRLQARTLTAAQQAALNPIVQHLEEVRSRWRVTWERKATREFHARLNLWRDFLEEYRQDAEANADRYPYEVSRRVILQLLSAVAMEVPEFERDLLQSLDGLLEAVFVPGDFIWETDLLKGFSPTTYWYLYGRLRI